MADFTARIEAVIKYIPALLKEVSQKFPAQIQSLIMSEMEVGEPDQAWRDAKPFDDVKAFDDKNATWSKSTKLRSQTGRYIASYLPNNENSLSKVKITKDSLQLTVGSKLANPHEKGGFIRAKEKLGSVSRKKTVWAMEQMFWARYMQSKNVFFKIMALSVSKNGGITIKARPHFAPAMKRFEDEVASQWLDIILYKLLHWL